jgi:hypothetical protein
MRSRNPLFDGRWQKVSQTKEGARQPDAAGRYAAANCSINAQAMWPSVIFSKFWDAPDQLVRKTPLYASAFLKLASDFFGG